MKRVFSICVYGTQQTDIYFKHIGPSYCSNKMVSLQHIVVNNIIFQTFHVFPCAWHNITFYSIHFYFARNRPTYFYLQSTAKINLHFSQYKISSFFHRILFVIILSFVWIYLLAILSIIIKQYKKIKKYRCYGGLQWTPYARHLGEPGL